MPRYDFVEADTGSKLTVYCKDQDGNTLNLTGYTAVRIFWKCGGRPVRCAEMTVSDATSGIAYYQFADRNDLAPGTMTVDIETEDGSHNVKTSLDPLTYSVRARTWR